MAELDTHCSGLRACEGSGTRECSDGEVICAHCGKLLDRPERQRRRRVQAGLPSPAPRKRVVPSGVQVERPLPEPIADPRPRPERIVSHQCPSCVKGRIGRARWDAGVRTCVTCDPLHLVAVGVHKSIPVIAFSDKINPNDVGQGRRRG